MDQLPALSWPDKPVESVVIVFDGGSKGNPGKGYGSYALELDGVAYAPVPIEFPGNSTTNNEAEYDTLLRALAWVHLAAQQAGQSLGTLSVFVRGDSKLVIEQVRGKWKCNNDRLRPRRDRAQSLLKPFQQADVRWHGREYSVARLGH